MNLLITHPIVNERVKHRVGHREPVESQVDVLGKRRRSQRLMVVDQHEVSVVRQPAQREHHHD